MHTSLFTLQVYDPDAYPLSKFPFYEVLSLCNIVSLIPLPELLSKHVIFRAIRLPKPFTLNISGRSQRPYSQHSWYAPIKQTQQQPTYHQKNIDRPKNIESIRVK